MAKAKSKSSSKKKSAVKTDVAPEVKTETTVSKADEQTQVTTESKSKTVVKKNVGDILNVIDKFLSGADENQHFNIEVFSRADGQYQVTCSTHGEKLTKKSKTNFKNKTNGKT